MNIQELIQKDQHTEHSQFSSLEHDFYLDHCLPRNSISLEIRIQELVQQDQHTENF